MSSFLHSPKHFNSIEKSLIELKKNNRNTGFCSDISIIEIESIISNYRGFSCICVTNQYKHHFENLAEELKNAYKSLDSDKSYLILKPIELYKAINSMEYQIDFNHIGRDFTDTEKIAIEKFNQIKFELCDLIIQYLPEYENSKCW